jgi:hypothetical protein
MLMVLILWSCTHDPAEDKAIAMHLQELEAYSRRTEGKILQMHYRMMNVARENGFRKADLEVVEKVEEMYDIYGQLDGVIRLIENGHKEHLTNLPAITSSFE